jgi:hypothetical protein
VFANFGSDPKGYSVGGLVDGFARRFAFDMPSFAGGGLALAGVSGGRGLHPVILQLPSGEKLHGLKASPSVVDRLTRELRLDRLTTSGRDPRRGR